MRKVLLLLGFLICTVISEAQVNLYVDNSRTTSGSGTGWTSAFKTLNEALSIVNDHPSSRYRVHIAKGTYYPTGMQAGTNRDSSFFLMRGGVSLYGGYPNGGGTRNAGANPTILSGNIGVDSLTTDNSYHIMVLMPDTVASTDSIIINGLDFTQGNANGANYLVYRNNYVSRDDAGAIYNCNTKNPVMLYGCNFYGNRSAQRGGAVYNDHSGMDIISCSFSGNISPRGGCLYNWGAKRQISDCIFSSNQTFLGEGAAIYTFNDSVIIYRSTFSNNSGGTGGAIYSLYNTYSDTSFTVDDCTFINNAAYYNGGAIYDYGDLNSTMSHFYRCTFENNTAGEGGAIYAIYNNSFGDNNVIRKCTFERNKATNGRGGGAFVRSNSGSFVVDSNTFRQNKAVTQGGGLFAIRAQASTLMGVLVKNSTFIADSSGDGGGLYCGLSVYIVNCTFQSNNAVNGGGVYCLAPEDAVINNSVFSGNTATSSGGGLYSLNSLPAISLSMRNSLFSGNKALLRGGAMSYSSMWPQIVNCTLAGDSALTGNGIYCDGATSLRAFNSIIWEGVGNGIVHLSSTSPVINSCIVQGGYPGANASTADPLFVMPLPATAAPFPGGDYRLRACSPAIDAGINIGSYAAVTDLAGNARLYGTNVDIGAYELQGTHPTSITGSSELCLGGTLRLNCTSPGGVWRSSDTTKVYVGVDGLITGIDSGMTAVYYKVSGSCADSAAKIITVGVLDTGITQIGLQLTAKQNGATYQWVNCGNGYAPVPGQTGQTFMTSTSGQYAVIISWNGCIDTSACRMIMSVDVAGTAANAGELGIYPNPSASAFTVTVKGVKPDMIRIRDITGRLVKQIPATGDRTRIDLHNATPGVYLVEVIQGNKHYTGRVSIVY